MPLLTFRNKREAPLAAAILLIRHAAHGDLGERLTGRGPESGLSPVGKEQAKALANSLRSEPFASIYSSPRLRTLQTAQAIAAGRGMEVQVSSALDEIDFGDWTGRSFADLEGDFQWTRWNEARSQARCPNGESMGEAQLRAARFLDEVAEKHAGGQVAVATHCDIIRALLCLEHGRSLDLILSFAAEPASVTGLCWGSSDKAAA